MKTKALKPQILIGSFISCLFYFIPGPGLAQPYAEQQKIAIEETKRFNKYLNDLAQGDVTSRTYLDMMLEQKFNMTYDDITGKMKEIEFVALFNQLMTNRGKYRIEFKSVPQLSELYYVKASSSQNGAEIIVVPVHRLINGIETDGFFMVRAASGKIVNYYRNIPGQLTLLPFQQTDRPVPKVKEEPESFIEKPGSISFEMIFIKGGTFEMGSNDGKENEKPAHSMTVSDFYLGKTEVTVTMFSEFVASTGYQTDAEISGSSYAWYQGDWEKVQGANWRCDPLGNKRSESESNHPVVFISWRDANMFCEWLSSLTHKKYRLPTEAEWEYAAGNGVKHTKFSWGNEYLKDNYVENTADVTLGNQVLLYDNDITDGYAYTSPVGKFRSNEMGLYDMAGNVSEWTADPAIGYPGSVDEGKDPGTQKVRKGGSWRLINYHVSFRQYAQRKSSDGQTGFRICCSK